MKKLIAPEGMILTNGEIYGREIFLSVKDKEENYHEISLAAYEEILKQQENQA